MSRVLNAPFFGHVRHMYTSHLPRRAQAASGQLLAEDEGSSAALLTLCFEMKLVAKRVHSYVDFFVLSLSLSPNGTQVLHILQVYWCSTTPIAADFEIRITRLSPSKRRNYALSKHTHSEQPCKSAALPTLHITTPETYVRTLLLCIMLTTQYQTHIGLKAETCLLLSQELL